jgi:hypothetical protein
LTDFLPGERLFTIPPEYDVDPVILLYDVARGDQRFLMARVDLEQEEGDTFVLVNNFFEELRERVGN